MNVEKEEVAAFWDAASCGEELYLDPNLSKEGYQHQLEIRYQLEPYIEEFAQFNQSSGKDVLEIGVGLGADHQRWAESGAKLSGIDLTERAISHVRNRFGMVGLNSVLQVGDAESLPYSDGSFDLVYSWGVLHHTPDTQTAFDEVWRVLRPGGVAKIMIYHKYSIIGLMLWLRYGLLAGRPFRSMADIYANHLESPGTKAYTVTEARDLCFRYSEASIETVLTHGDLLTSDAGQRHRGLLLTAAKKIWPRTIIKRFFPVSGLFMLITAIK